jgi:oligopeptide transport system substrate-binding protein
LYSRPTNWSSKAFDSLVDRAAVESDVKKRTELYAQAEKILVYDEAAVMPLYWYTRSTLTKPYVKRTYAVASQEHFEKWEMLPH